MSVLHHHSVAAERSLIAWTLLFCATGFATGFLLSLLVASYSLYVCVVA
jgi:hypothetical protein